jgi:hypothetical protein
MQGTVRYAAIAVGLGALALAGCGGSRQDAGEPSGTFPVNIVRATFPQSQRLAGQVRMVITVNNAGSKTIPNIGVTIEGANGAAPAAAFGTYDTQAGLASPSRPIWIVDRGPIGGDTAYVNTWTLGKLAPHQEKTFVWFVTPTVGGTHTVRYRVSAGLNGKAKAQLAGGGVPSGSFTVVVNSKPAGVKVSPNGDVTSSPPSSKAVPPGYPVGP